MLIFYGIIGFILEIIGIIGLVREFPVLFILLDFSSPFWYAFRNLPRRNND